MNPSDWAVFAVTAIGLAHVVANYRLQMRALEKIGDRVRVVSPPKAQQQDKPDSAAKAPDVTLRSAS